MNDVEVTLTLPNELVSRAKEAGILETKRMTRMIEDELKRQTAGVRLQSKLESLRAASEPMSEEDALALVNAEIKAYRAENRRGGDK